MKLIAMILSALLSSYSFALAEGPSGRGAVTGDPAASSANPSDGLTCMLLSGILSRP